MQKQPKFAIYYHPVSVLCNLSKTSIIRKFKPPPIFLSYHLNMTTVKYDYENLAERLIINYTKQINNRAIESLRKNELQKYFNRLSNEDRRFMSNILGLSQVMVKYNKQDDCDLALDKVDLEKIYAGVDVRENEENPKGLMYEDHIVLELLHYFKNSFFKWITKPQCPVCKESGDNIVATGVSPPPVNNPDEISRIENYRCQTCNRNVDFIRYNSARKLLDTREGRCGEWVNCFLLILKALLGADAKVRYVWNYEDHVWCEYYSIALKRWIHLDPCEAVSDSPHLYCNNWGKKMSFVIGFGEDYIVDLSDKYITQEKQIDKKSILKSTQSLKTFIRLINNQKLLKYFETTMGLSESERYKSLYYNVVLIHNQEVLSLKKGNIEPTKTTSLPKGRQTGGKEWTGARGEDG